jgi:hypothetical protein
MENMKLDIDKSYEASKKKLFPEGIVIPKPVRAVHLLGFLPVAVRKRTVEFCREFLYS